MVYFKSIIEILKEKKINIENIKDAYEFAEKAHDGQFRKSGEAYISHPIEVAKILLEIGADEETIIAALLHDTVEDTGISLKEIRKKFGNKVEKLVNAVTKIDKLHIFSSSKDWQVANLKKMFSGALENERAILIKIADRAHNIQSISAFTPQKQERIATETMKIYHPLAKLYGIWKIKRIFEDFCFPVLERKNFEQFSQLTEKFFHENKKTCEREVKKIKILLNKKIPSVKVNSVYKSPFEVCELFKEQTFADKDVRSFWHIEIIVPTIENCYQSLGILHSIFSAQRKGFFDFISTPKSNGYQAIHTSIFTGEKIITVIIKTNDMDITNEYCPFFFFPEKFLQNRFRKTLRAIDRKYIHADYYLKDLDSNILHKNIFILGENQRESYLPENATALDGIFSLFPRNAVFVKKIFVNEQDVSFNTILKNDDFLSAEFSAQKTLSLDWVNSLETASARNFVVREVREKNKIEKIYLGEEILRKEFDLYGKGGLFTFFYSDKSLLSEFSVNSIEEIFLLVAEGLLPAHEVLEFLEGKESFLQKIKKKIFGGVKKNTTSGKFELLVQEGENLALDIFSLAHREGINVKKFNIEKKDMQQKKSKIKLILSSNEKKQRDRFFLELNNFPLIIEIKILLSFWMKIYFGALLFSTIFSWIFFLFTILKKMESSSFIHSSVAVFLILVTHFFLYRFLSNYIPFFRKRRFAFFFSFLNTIALGLYTAFLLTKQSNLLNFSFFVPLTFLVASIMTIAIVSFRGKIVPNVDQKILPLQEWKNHNRKKVIGYIIRFAAVIIWGIQPIFLKYTAVANVSPLLRVFLLSFGAAFFAFLVHKFFFRPKKDILSLPKNTLFFIIIIAEASFRYFINASLVLTSSTNFILFNNFAPILALIVAAILWRGQIPYLQKPNTTLAIFFIFFLGSIGSTLLFYNDIKHSSATNLLGDFLAIIAMIIDVILVTAMIRYSRFLEAGQSAGFSAIISSAILIFSLPISFLYFSEIMMLSWYEILLTIFWGCCIALGTILNYEAFRRIDGFLAFLMFNISILLTFSVEAFFLKEISPTPIIIIGGILIISASIFAEKINTECEKKERLSTPS
jgi:GTP diphosphokinase / guanosine-3',5'-bis(diphosphate) 3'-diphosphatase